MKKYTSHDDFADNIYYNVLTFFLNKADSFEIVIRTDIDFLENFKFMYDNSAYDLINELKPYLYSEKEDREWTASCTFDKPAKIYTGIYNADSLNIILKYTSKVSDWQGPKTPEDLSLLNQNNSLLSFIGHESMSLWSLDEESLKFVNEMPISLLSA